LINKYYQQQISLLRELGSEFSHKYPVLAPMLAGQSADPDVERLLEGTAFLTGAVQERLDDDFPELVHGLTELMFPHYLHPIPSSTIIKFSGQKELITEQVIPVGTELASRIVDNQSCRFTTTNEVRVYPLEVAVVEDTPSKLTLKFSFKNGSLKYFNLKQLKLFISGNFGDAANMIFTLVNSLKEVTLSDANHSIKLSKKESINVLSKNELSVIPYKEDMFNAFRIVQEYFQLPESFCFFDLLKLDALNSDSSSFNVSFEFDDNRAAKYNGLKVDFCLFCVPAVNIFKYEAETILVDFHQAEYKVMPYRNNSFHIYSVDRVVGFVQGTVNEREYKPFSRFNPQSTMQPVYSIKRRKARLAEGTDVYISVATPSSVDDFNTETLVLGVTCTNGEITEKLRLGDICEATETTPLFVEFTNITHPTSPAECPLGNNLLWRMLSHIYLNQKSVATLEALTSLLKLYIFTDTNNKSQVQVNTRKVESIQNVSRSDATRLVNGVLLRGSKINISFNAEGFASRGDMYIFANVIQSLLGDYTAINNFTIVDFTDLSIGESFRCQELQLGSRNLL
jgi:type VI secretion system protein ImpG